MKKITSFFFVIISLLLSACHDTKLYRREFPDLHIIAVESVIGSINDEMNRVVVIDEDDYGRKLFAFSGFSPMGHNNNSTSIIAILISQRTDHEYSYYYDSLNFISKTIDSEFIDLSVQEVNNYFSQEDFEKLKTANDWNKPIDEEKLFRVEITRKKVCDIEAKDVRKYSDFFSEELYYSSINCYATDQNRLTLVYVLSSSISESGYNRIFLFLFNRDHELISTKALIHISSQSDIEAIYQFKLQNGWTFSYGD
jgi:hypothetical protein